MHEGISSKIRRGQKHSSSLVRSSYPTKVKARKHKIQVPNRVFIENSWLFFIEWHMSLWHFGSYLEDNIFTSKKNPFNHKHILQIMWFLMTTTKTTDSDKGIQCLAYGWVSLFMPFVWMVEYHSPLVRCMRFNPHHE